MGTKTVRLDDDVYEHIRAVKQEDETFSEAIDRLIGRASLLELAGTLSDEEVDAVREAVADSREADRRATEALYGDET
jgi:predicted CopG family antitoxin